MSTGRGRKKSSSVWEHFCKPDEKNSVEVGTTPVAITTVQGLLPLKVASDFIEGDKYVTTAAIIPLIKGLLSNYSSSFSTSSASVHISAFRQKIKSAIKCRFDLAVASDDVPFPSLFDMATWLHPAYKEKYFKPHHATRVRLHLKSEMISDTTIAVIAPPHNPIPVGDSTTSSVSMMENLFNLGMEVQQSNQEDADDEGADIDTIVTNEKEFPMLYNICQKYLSLPASERCFSSTGLTATVLRSRLTESHLEALNILHCNKQLLD
ncbi:uncharacterized protein LOC143451695 [Clavelina lepadiformis]|uniref:uncharacterized protein LOC143451695 n=1 Tax=Clavelina lepadiformis TaxID=159417 RepID=UPI0040434C0B